MIIKEFNVEELNLNYYVGVSQIKLDLIKILNIDKLNHEKKGIDIIFTIIKSIENKFPQAIIQLFNGMYILNQSHIFIACYFVQKIFQEKNNISNNKNIELLLYFSANRQISKAIEVFGINNIDLKSADLNLCILSPINNLVEIKNEILQNLNAVEVNLVINNQSFEKLSNIKRYFEVSDKQIHTILKSYGIQLDNKNDNLDYLYLAIQDLLYEKMALLNSEIVKVD